VERSVTIDSLSDDPHGDLNGQGTCAVPQVVAAGDTYECAFSVFVGGNAGDSETDTVVASGSGDNGDPVSDQDSFTVGILDTLPSIAVTKTATPTVVHSGESVTFTIRVSNESREPITLDGLSDTVFGDLAAECDLPVDIVGDGFFECTISRTIRADHMNTVTANVEDDEGNEAAGSAVASVDVVGPAIRVTAEASVDMVEVGEVIAYTYTVENAGDETLSDVIAHDNRLGAILLSRTTLGLGEVTIGNATYRATEGDRPGPIVNTVVVTGTSPAQVVVINIDTVKVALIQRIHLPLIIRTYSVSSTALQ
jgi:uncharacterized repeat protein (TIGR01451 family)